MSAAENKALLRRYWQAIDRGDVAVLDEFVAPDYIDHAPGAPGLPDGREGLRLFFEMSLAGFTDFQHTIEDLIAEDDRVVSRVSASGVHSGDFLGIPATGKHVTLTSITIHRVRDGKLVEHWSQSDTLGMLQQLGLLPALRQAPA